MTSRNPLRRLAAGGALAAALLVSLVPAAQAATYRHTDATGDVRVSEENVGAGTVSDRGAQPGVLEGDITSLTVQHTSTAVKVATALRGTPPLSSSWQARIVTSRGTNIYDLRRIVRDTGTTVELRRNGRVVSCDGIRVVPTSSGIVGSVPRTCLGTPYKVRAGVVVNALLAADKQGTNRVYTRGRDDALRVGDATIGSPTLGSWVTAS